MLDVDFDCEMTKCIAVIMISIIAKLPWAEYKHTLQHKAIIDTI